MKKLLQHFKAMQDKARAYIEPTLSYTDVDGKASDATLSGLEPPYRNFLFANDMVYMLDGPEQREAEADAAFDYVEQAHQTLSPAWHGELVSRGTFDNRLFSAIFALQQLDEVKKTLFYGKDNNLRPMLSRPGCENMPEKFCEENNTQSGNTHLTQVEVANLIHGIIGLATEAGELLELLRDTIDGKPFDRTNLEEEVGDGKWYMAILARVGGFVWGNDERKNIAKLRARFPNRFTEYDANNRQLAAEREILEGQHALPFNETAARRFEAGGGGIPAATKEI